MPIAELDEPVVESMTDADFAALPDEAVRVVRHIMGDPQQWRRDHPVRAALRWFCDIPGRLLDIPYDLADIIRERSADSHP